MMNSSIIYLVGFMGAGKSSVGSRLAAVLGRPFIDLDVEIQRREGRSVPEIFRHRGEDGFRRIERQELERVCALRDIVVALGGGAFCSGENQLLVQPTGVSVWLDASLDVMLSRCEKDGTRPLLADREEMEALLERRRPLYAMAEIRIDTSVDSVDIVAEKIMEALRIGPWKAGLSEQHSS
jgi:shikimate kinase